MSFAQRDMRFTFTGGASSASVDTITTTFSDGQQLTSPGFSTPSSFSASGLRAAATIEAFQGPLGVQGEVKIWGLSLAQMNAFSTAVPSAISSELPNVALTIEAGDVGKPLSKVIDSPIFQSFIDLSGVPESAFAVSVAGIYQRADPSSGQSWAGAQNAEDLIASLAPLAGIRVQNNGAHAVLRNMNLPPDSVLNQIFSLASAANFSYSWGLNQTLNLWPSGGTIDDVVVDVGPNTAAEMVGYPQWWQLGLIVTSLFNPEIQVGRQMNVISSIPKAQGLWSIIKVQHNLTTMIDKGPWFTTAVLAAVGT